ncbi:class F sortase [Streptomyces sp. NPDC016845]|uniref:class F sortase n=1 Tax=Streptomyces sp. NPDC016845 TaxID=3364972 RepID=UPI0037946061
MRFKPVNTANAAVGVVTLLALATGAWLLAGGAAGHPPPQPAPEQADAAANGTARRTGAPPMPKSPPTRIRIPSLQVDAPLTALGLSPRGSLEVPPPRKENLAGWYEAGTSPGERGTAVVAGHVDNAEGPAVFYGLGALRRGRTVEVDRRDGSVAVFTVDAVRMYAAKDFPDEKVYGSAERAELRVITCGGPYSRRTGYEGNVVVFAHLTDSR